MISHSKYSSVKIVCLVFFLFVAVMHGQTKKIIFSGVVNNDIRKIIDMPVDNIKPLITLDESPKKKSLFLAGVFSAILPGSGEFYSEQYIKAAVFVGIEAAAIIVGVINNKKGDDKTNEFQLYAQKNWSVDQYARWTLVHARSINSDVDPSAYAEKLWDKTGKVDWNVLNELETAIGQGTNYYSHRLAYYGEQQYYEMIGKYPQFNPGWSDFGNENTAYKYGDPVTAHFTYYSGERGKANDFYNVASKAVVVIVTNHVISMFDAIWSAASFNKKLQLNMSLKQDQAGYRMVYSTVLNLKYNF